MTSTSTSPAGPSASRAGQPGPFPVFIVRAATVTLPGYLRRQRGRQRGANQLAAALTEQCRAAGNPGHEVDHGCWINLDDPYDELRSLTDRPVVADLVRQARVLAEAPPPGAVRIGRDRLGRPVVVVLHGRHWSLVLRRAHPTPAAWVFLDANGYRVRVHGVRELSVEWDEMTRDVYRSLSGSIG
ncbi:hypothetical protein [Dactylosporangium sp. CA-139066]|uniref:hypothetical protein n=1 Tax=Dactylosporangium sp. CA-139066 TaxID=3239930 RepID=UPI003D8C8A62